MGRGEAAVLLVGVTLVIGCGSSVADGEPRGLDASTGDAGRPTPMDPPAGGGACECLEAADCAAVAQQLLDELSVPDEGPADRRRAGSTCAVREPGAEPDCLCHQVWGAMTMPVPENDWVLGNRETCDIYGRVPGTCAVPASEFAGCDPAVADSCEALCQRAEELWLADLARTHDGELRHATCTPYEEGCSCRTVIRIDDRCYAAFGPGAHSYDCALPDAEILALEHPEPPAPCADAVCDAGAGTPGP